VNKQNKLQVVATLISPQPNDYLRKFWALPSDYVPRNGLGDLVIKAVQINRTQIYQN
tara:strand:- start:303 stop:473 length:171 start_codon:yes stop_codon:yes gene_type:complete